MKEKDTNFKNANRTANLFSDNKKLIVLGSGFLLTLAIAGISLLVCFLVIKKEPNTSCPDNYQFFATTGYCYKTYIMYSPHGDGVKHCESEGGSLVSIQSEIENSYVNSLYNWTLGIVLADVEGGRENDNIWLDLEYDIYEQEYFWSDGSRLSYHNFDYGRAQNESFVVMHANGGKWQSMDIYPLGSYTCKRPTGEAQGLIKKKCASGFTFVKATGFCYKAFLERSTFHQASQKCSSKGANLASIHSPEEHREVIKLYKNSLQKEFREKSFISLTYLWTGLTYNGSSWNWSDGSKFDWNNYQDDNWKSPIIGENWTAISIYNSNPQKTINDKWITVGDPNYFSFVCKKPDTSVTLHETPILPENSTITTPSTDIIGKSKNCSKDYKFFEMTGYCYKLAFEAANFTMANNKCQKEKGQLASIHSKEEDQFILELTKEIFGTDEEIHGEFYIGLIYQNNRWEWTDRSHVDYVNWRPEEPNFLKYETSTSKTYKVLKDHSVIDGWNNMGNDLDVLYYCKKPAV